MTKQKILQDKIYFQKETIKRLQRQIRYMREELNKEADLDKSLNCKHEWEEVCSICSKVKL